ncbi:MAG: hypothetical protein HYX51_00155 [Chloroflexi bacterium]|nr:hypothetical protein [Chloroflexota bacterium]
MRIDRAQFLPIVRRALGHSGAELVDWRHEPLDAVIVNPFTGGLYRVFGTARVDGAVVPWSMVLKVIRRPDWITGFDDPDGWRYWRREALAYESGLLDHLAGGLVAPRCFAVEHQSDGSIRLWLEDIGDQSGAAWSPERFGLAARHLGRFNGSYLAARPLPDQLWLTTGNLRHWVEGHAPVAALMERPETWEHPAVRRAFPVPVAHRLLDLWSARGRLLDALDTLPRVFGHSDAGRHNLLTRRRADGTDETIAIDWEFPGLAAPGEEIGILLTSPFFRLTLDIAHFADLDALVFDGYIDGLRDAGWQGNVDMARFAFTAYALRTVFIVPMLGALTDEQEQAREEQRWSHSMEEIMEQRGPLTYRLLDHADEARRLLERW